MARSETPKPQLVSKLSAEAESFVPGKFLGAANGSSGQPIAHQQLSQLPRYVTSCYPFVQGDPGQPVPTRGATPGPQTATRQSTTSTSTPAPRMPHPQNGGYPYGGPRNPGAHMVGGNGPHGVRPHVAQRHTFPARTPASPIQPAVFPATGALSLQSAAFPSPYYPYPHGPGPGWSNGIPGPYASGEFGPFSAGYFPPGAPYPLSKDSGDWNADKTKASERKSKKKKDMSNMVSIGVQNETGVLGTLNAKKKPTRTKTIILMDSALQTDFSDEIANLTLAEKPNSLFQKGSWPDYYDQDTTTTTDSEEVDSDSGYSSPLHRRNQASSGTHPFAGLNSNVGPVGPNPHPGGAKLPLPYPFLPGAGIAAGIVAPPRPPGVGYSYASVLSQPYNVSSVSNYSVSSFQPPALQGSGATIPTTSKSENSASSKPTNPHRDISPSQKLLSHHQSTGSLKTEPEGEAGTSPSGKRRRRRNRRRKKKSGGDEIGPLSDDNGEMHRAHSSSNVSRTSTVEHTEGALLFEDEEEFPNLMGSAGQARPSSAQSTTILSYSDILKSQQGAPATEGSCHSDQNLYSNSRPSSGREFLSDSSITNETTKENKNARKRRKRREMANRAAEEELAEITLEQEVLKELRSKHTPEPKSPVPPPQPAPVSQPSGKKSKQPISLNIADMIDALEKQQKLYEEEKRQAQLKSEHGDKVVANMLDASAPTKRGKEREVPKAKKPSPLKKVILKEREEKKRLRLFDDPAPLSPTATAPDEEILPVSTLPLDSDLSQDGLSSKTSSMDQSQEQAISADMSPISQTSPISMSPLSPGGSPLSSGINSPIANNNILGERKSSVVMRIHSRRFREYCTQILDKDIDNSCTALLQDLVRFQDRVFQKDSVKQAKSKRRIVLGLREVTKHLKLKKIKCVIISPNLERIQSKGGLDDALNNIIHMCTDQDIPFVFALGRRALGRACAKLVPVSVVGIFNFEGSEENFNRLMELTEKARNAYCEMVSLLEKEIGDTGTQKTSGPFPQLFAHMGHSRTPSACSAISFTSSILSEPISENYPHSEPETDSRGYEIVKPMLGVLSSAKEEPEMKPPMTPDVLDADVDRSDSPNSSNTSGGGKVKIVESLDEIDEGHEADTEDFNDTTMSVHTHSSCNTKESLSDSERGTVQDLPPIDSIHSSVVDLSAEILSQHSSKTLDLNIDVNSTHSSKTLGEGSTHGPAETGVVDTKIRTSESMDGREASPGSTSQRMKSIDKERIESWVADTQHQMERLGLEGREMSGAQECKARQDDQLNKNASVSPCGVCNTHAC